MYKRVLVAVDGSDLSNRALQAALKLINGQQCQVRIVHVVDTIPFSTGEMYIDYDAYRTSALEGGQEILDEAVEVVRQAGVEPETALIETMSTHPSASVVAEAERWSADLIVMGTHGRTGLMHLLLGSVAEGVVKNSKVPVLLVRGD